MNNGLDFNELGAQVLEEIKAGKPLFGKDGALAPLLENIINAALEGEMDSHLREESRQNGNRRNGKMQKQVHTPVGDVTVSTPLSAKAFPERRGFKLRIKLDTVYLTLPVKYVRIF